MISSSLFHFTKDADNLQNILRELAFKPFYNFEDVSEFRYQRRWLGIPMVCFCDIPLKFIEPHTENYGRYGIGMTKEWAMAKKLNPLQYVVDGSSLHMTFKELINWSDRQLRKAESLSPEELMTEGSVGTTDPGDFILRLNSFSKPYTYYLEREWRYVPDNCRFTFSDEDRIDTRKRHTEDNPYIALGFTPDDIQHIIVPDAEGVNQIIRFVEGLPMATDIKYKLVQKVQDLKTISRDF